MNKTHGVLRLMYWLENPTDYIALNEAEVREVLGRLDRAEIAASQLARREAATPSAVTTKDTA